jgi:DNA-binding NarL/FixJ family response regulator
MKNNQLLIADDHPLTLMGTKAYVEMLGYKVDDICSNGISALNLITAHQPAIAILDINMPGLDGLEVLEKIQKLKLHTKVILCTMHKEATIFNRANQLGAYGYLLKEHAQDELKECIATVEKGEKYVSKKLSNELIATDSADNNLALEKLTFTEKKVLELITQQKTSKQVAELLFISEKTVEGHRTNIIHKLELPKEKNSLLIWAMRHFKA